MASSGNSDRTEALLDVVLLRKSLADAVELLSRFPWDCDEELVTVDAKSVVDLLIAFRRGAISANDCYMWAEALESRDDVNIDNSRENDIQQFLFEVSTPELNGEMSLEIAASWIAVLTR